MNPKRHLKTDMRDEKQINKISESEILTAVTRKSTTIIWDVTMNSYSILSLTKQSKTD
jgi:hypothetical protein